MKFLMVFAVCLAIVGVSFANEAVPEVKGTARCLLKQASGDAKFSCLAAIPSWYHDHEAGVCKEFIYGGCGGNANRFNSKADCDAACASLHADDHQHHHHH